VRWPSKAGASKPHSDVRNPERLCGGGKQAAISARALETSTAPTILSFVVASAVPAPLQAYAVFFATSDDACTSHRPCQLLRLNAKTTLGVK